MLRVIYSVERNLGVTPTPPVTIPAATATEVIKDTRTSPGELAIIQIQNIGDGDAYYAYGRDCDGDTNIDGELVSGGILSVPHRLKVSLYSVDGTQVTVSILTRPM